MAVLARQLPTWGGGVSKGARVSQRNYHAATFGQMQLVVVFVGALPGLAVGYHRDVFFVFHAPLEVAAGGPVVASGV